MSLYEIHPNYIASEDNDRSNVNLNSKFLKLKKRSKRNSNSDNGLDNEGEKSGISTLLDTSNVPVNSLRTLGYILSNVRPQSQDSWHQWIDYIKHHDPNLCLKEAALVYTRSGNVIAASKGISISAEEAKSIKELFEHNSHMAPESFRCSDRTYVTKSITEGAVIGFYGGTYCIISQSQKLLVVALCTSRTRSQGAMNFVVKVAEKLSKTNH